MKILAFIPARGGSKRFPKKNIARFKGKPLLWHTVQAALRADVFKKIVVSSDEEHILSCVPSSNIIELDKRGAELSSDSATIVDVVLEYLTRKKSSGTTYDAVCVLYATAVLRDSEDIKNTCALLADGKANFAQAISRYEKYPHQALFAGEKKFLLQMWPDLADLRASELPEMFCGNGSTYAATTKAIFKYKSFQGPKMRGYIMPFWKSIDIDYPEDLEMVKCLSRYPSCGGRVK